MQLIEVSVSMIFMLKLSILLAVSLGTTALPSTISSTVLATVNGDPIYESDITSDSHGQTREEKIKNAIHYRLIVQEAKKRGLERSPEIQASLNDLLYKKFIADEKRARKLELSPTDSELHVYYRKYPLIRIHHLMLYQRNETERQLANLTREQISKEIKKGTPFEQLCLQYSQDSSGLFGGDTDFRGPHNFPKELYLKIKSLPKNKISDPIEIGKAVHFFEWFDKKPFTAAPASYLQFLQAQLEQEREIALLKDIVSTLKKTASVETKSLSVKANELD